MKYIQIEKCNEWFALEIILLKNCIDSIENAAEYSFLAVA